MRINEKKRTFTLLDDQDDGCSPRKRTKFSCHSTTITQEQLEVVAKQLLRDCSLIVQLECFEVLRVLRSTCFAKAVDKYFDKKVDVDQDICCEVLHVLEDQHSTLMKEEERFVMYIMEFVAFRNGHCANVDRCLFSLSQTEEELYKKLTTLFLAQKALFHSERSEFEDALACCTRAIELEAGSSVLFYGRALCKKYLEMDHLCDLNRSISLDPYKFVAYVDRAKEFCRQGKYKEAVSDLWKFISLTPSYSASSTIAYAYYMLSECYIKLNQHMDVVHCLSKVISFDPHFNDASLTLGLFLLKIGSVEQAEEQLTQLIQSSSKCIPDALCARSTCYFLMGDYSKALEDCEHVLSLQGDTSSRSYKTAWLNLAGIYQMWSQYVVALNCVNRSTSSQSDNNNNTLQRYMQVLHSSSSDVLFNND